MMVAATWRVHYVVKFIITYYNEQRNLVHRITMESALRTQMSYVEPDINMYSTLIRSLILGVRVMVVNIHVRIT